MLKATRRTLIAAGTFGAGLAAYPLLPTRDAQAQTAQRDAFTIMASDARFSTWVEMLTQGGIASYARGATPFTAFVPTNVVFDRLPQVRQDLLPQSANAFPDSARLIGFIRAHVLYGLHEPAAFQGRRQSLPSVAGSPIELDGTVPGGIAVSWRSVDGRTGRATLDQAPIRASNALIYPINAVELG